VPSAPRSRAFRSVWYGVQICHRFPGISRTLRFSLLRSPNVRREGYRDDRREDRPGARSYETNRDVKWICKTGRAAGCERNELEKPSGFESGAGAPSGTTFRSATEESLRRPKVFEERSSRASSGRWRAGGNVGGVMAVIVRVLPPAPAHISPDLPDAVLHQNRSEGQQCTAAYRSGEECTGGRIAQVITGHSRVE